MGFRNTSFVMSAEQWERTLELARGFRACQSMAEDLLWNELRARKLRGIKFRRQHPIGPYVVDFYAPQYRLAVEVDGPIHESRRRRDHVRQRLLEAQGVRFVRLTSQDVETHLAKCLNLIAGALMTNPHP